MQRIILIAHNLRSTHNVGSLLRTAEGLGVEKVYLTGYTPYPAEQNDARLPHIVRKLDRHIRKTALGAEMAVQWHHAMEIEPVIGKLREEGFTIAAVEQTADSISLPEYSAPSRIALIVGREVEGIEPEVLALTDIQLEIPMLGEKESFNVTVAAAMALYHCRYCVT